MLKPGVFTLLGGCRFGVPNPNLFFSPYNGPPVVWAFLCPLVTILLDQLPLQAVPSKTMSPVG